MFLRFVQQRTNEDSGVREGLFRAAYALSRDSSLPFGDRVELTGLLEWFERNLTTPDRFNRTTSKGYYRRATRGIAWLKPSASEHIAQMHVLAALLDRNGYATEMIKSERPGYVVYEDDAQIIAEPFRDTPT
ncbi:MAG: hypothetical protein R3C46_13170 [Hyphomonadaceae bacterium]